MSQDSSDTFKDVVTKTQRYSTYILIGVAIFILISVVLDFIEPNYNHVTQTLSDHLNNSFRWVMFIAFSGAVLACWGLSSAVRTVFSEPIQSKWVVRFFGIAALGFMTASIFPANPDKTDTLGTISTVIHLLAALITFVFLLIAINMFSHRLNKAGLLEGGYKALRWLALVAPVMLVVLVLSGPSGYVGVAQRVFFVFIFGWMILFAVGLRSGALIDGVHSTKHQMALLPSHEAKTNVMQ